MLRQTLLYAVLFRLYSRLGTFRSRRLSRIRDGQDSPGGATLLIVRVDYILTHEAPVAQEAMEAGIPMESMEPPLDSVVGHGDRKAWHCGNLLFSRGLKYFSSPSLHLPLPRAKETHDE